MRAEGFSIPVDWGISIDDEGHATVDDASGRITADTDSKHGGKDGDGGRLPDAPANRETKENGGEGDRLPTHQRASKLCHSLDELSGITTNKTVNLRSLVFAHHCLTHLAISMRDKGRQSFRHFGPPSCTAYMVATGTS